MRRIIASLSLLLIVALLASCQPPSRDVWERPDEEPVTLRVAWWGGDLRNEATIQVIRMFEQQHPHVRIEFEYTGFNEYWKKLAPYAAGNALPDVIQMDVSYLSQYGSLELLEDLTSYIDQGLIDTTHISESTLAGGKMGNKLYGFNLGVNALYTVYDPQVFQASGLQPPEADWTWDDLEAMGSVVKGTGTYVGTDLTPEQFFAYYLRQHGKNLYAADGTKLGYDDDSLFVDYFGRMQRLARDRLIFTPDIWNTDLREGEEDPFYQGKALLGWGYSNQFIGATRKYGKPLSIAPPPGPNLDKGMFLKPGMMFSIAQNSKVKEEAAKFISFFVNDVEANKILKGERGVPVSKKVQDELTPYIEPELEQIFDYIRWVEQHSSPMDPLDPPGSAEVTDVLRKLYDQLLFDTITPEFAAVEFRRKASEILARNIDPR
ncbi:multiple sugar transport system substrate-binding protein [Paenibacillus phyllosphaerae]|uniref:Multiple sugar transport system substrate-binding protein n=1 Tax=Paenibacillus phyllosphaerae TaxID=274593 RepID=A0A7W5B130_9BACL|nr:extracellular solute-binding protein [Paenibacillus phyllosphaerae]MBB3112447.1 multiple sugar transport system substrate-binding protein [Paenibacillus phyllosphaerae]